MSDLPVVDEEYLFRVAASLRDFAEMLLADTSLLKDKDAEPFVRYLVYNRASNLLNLVDSVFAVCRRSLRTGFNLNHPIFQSEHAVQGGWDVDFSVQGDDYFVGEKQESKSSIRDMLKEACESLGLAEADEEPEIHH